MPHQYSTSSVQFQSLSILFTNTFIMPGFLSNELTRNIRDFLVRVAGGLLFHREMVRRERDLVYQIMASSGLPQAANFLLLLEKLASVKQPESFQFKHPRMSATFMKTQDITRYIRDNAHRGLRIEEVARAVNMSRCHFSRFFNQQFGCNFNQFVRTVRIERACILLRDSRRSVSEVAFASGFDSISSFNRGFLKLKNMPPLAYRKQWPGPPGA